MATNGKRMKREPLMGVMEEKMLSKGRRKNESSRKNWVEIVRMVCTGGETR
jgi:hypothetical protein